MAVLGRLLISSAERVDLPDMLSIDSYAAGDWKFFLKGLVGDAKPFILKGFDIIDPQNAIGTQSCSIRVADSMVFYPGSNSGSFFHGLQEGHPQAAPLVPELRKNATNFVYLTFSTFNTSVDTRAFWDPDKDGGVGGEFTQDVNTESVLKVDVSVSTGSFPANTIPIAKVTVGPVVITSITDCRDLLFRLGTGGINPDPFQNYQFRSLPSASFQRNEPPITMLAGGDNPFQGGDKNVLSLKEWMDLVMTKFKELSGTTYWYEDLSSFSLISGFIDALSTTFKSKGQWQHSSATPGLVTWTEDIQIKITQDPRDTIVRAGNKTLANEEVAYISLQRNKLLNVSDQAVSWTNGQPYVNTVGGAVGYFANLAQGDWVKKVNDQNHLYLRVEQFYDSVNLGGSTTTAANARSIRLSANYQGTTAVERGRYDKGVYQPSDIVVSARSAAPLSTVGGNFHWLVTRSDVIENMSSIDTFVVSGTLDQTDGKTARVVATAHGLSDGDRITVTAPVAQAGTYTVEVEDANTFYIETTDTTDGAFTGFYGLATTAARDNGYGLQLESANHGFESGDTVIVAGTTNFNGAYIINKRTDTQFQFAFGSDQAAETTGTATLARVNVRAEQGLVKIVQGETIDIGEGGADNLKKFIGMGSLAETHPIYNITPGYNTLDGMQNYNSSQTDNLTARASKLTAMMGDRAQDKTVKYAPSPSLTTIVNTTNGAAQEITFLPGGSTLTIITPGSTGNATIALPSVAPGISLLVNQVAYVDINRNSPTTPAITVVDTADLTIDENIFVIAARLDTTAVYLWEGSLITSGSSPFVPEDVIRQNQTLKLVEGGIWNWDLVTETVSWSADAFIQIIGLANSVNQILAGSAVLAAGEVAYVDINRVGPGGTLTVTVATNATLTPTTNRIIIARREGNDVIIGAHSTRVTPSDPRTLYGDNNKTNTVTVIDDVSTSLPSGPTATIDGISLVDGDKVLFTKLTTVSDRGIYVISGVGSSIAWTKLDAFNGSDLPYDGSYVYVRNGDSYRNSMYEHDGIDWKRADNADVTFESTGFPNRTDSEISFDDGTRTLTIQPTGTSFDYYERGVRYRKSSAQNVVIPNVEGLYFIYFDGATLTQSSSFSDDILNKFVYVATVYWDATNLTGILVGEERHGLTLDWATHKYLHTINGTQVGSGLAAGNFTIAGTGSALADAQISVANGTLFDEDIIMSIANAAVPANPFEQILSPAAEIPVYYRDGASGLWRKNAALNYPLMPGVGGTALPEITDITCVAGSAITSGQYFNVNSANDVNKYSFWYRVDSLGSAPVVPGRTLVMIDILSTDTDAQVATATEAVVEAQTGLSSTVLGAVVTITNDENGTTTDAANVDVPGLTAIVTQQGAEGPLPKYNLFSGGTWTQPNASGNNYIAMWVFGTNNINEPIIAFLGQRQDASLSDAQQNNTYESLTFGALPSAEMKILYRLIYQVNSNYSNTPHAALRDVRDLRKSVDTSVGAYSASDHGLLTGLLDPDHPASAIYTDTANFDRILSAADTTVQKALDTLNDNAVDASEVFQDRNAKMIKGGTWLWNSGTGALSWSANAFIQIPGLAENRNQISAGSTVLSADGQVAWVDINRNAGSPAVLTVNTGAASGMPEDADRFIIARRTGSDVLVGTHSMLLINGESKALDAGISDQHLSFTGASNNADATPDYAAAVAHTLRYITENTSLEEATAQLDNQLDKLFGQLRLRQQTPATKRVIVTGADTSILDGTTLSQQTRNLLLNFEGAEIEFETGVIYEDDGITPLGINFTPATIAVNQYRWYSVTLVPSTVGADNRISGQILVLPAAADGASPALAPRAPFPTGLKLGQVVVQNSATPSIINVIPQTQIVQLGSGSGSGGDGTGDANSFLETLKNLLNDSFYDAFTSNIFSIDTDDKVDPASTGEYSIVDNTFVVDAGETLVSTQNLDAPFLLDDADVESVQLAVQWAEDNIDTAATYEVSRDGGLHWQPITMDRVDTSDTYIGEKTFDVESVAYSDALATTSSNTDLTAAGGAREALGIQISLAADTYVTELSVYLSKIGTIAGNYRITLWADSSGLPISMLEAGNYASANAVTGSAVKYTAAINKTMDAGTYHIVLETDAAYKASYSVGVNALQLHGAAGATIETLTSGIWSEGGPIIGAYEVLGTVEDFLSIDTYALANNDSNRTLNQTTQQKIGQQFTLSASSLVKRVAVEVNKLGSPTGQYYLAIVADDTGFPSTDLADVLVESSPFDIGSLGAGTSTVNLDIPENVLLGSTPYHLVFRVVYTAFSAGVNELRIRDDQSAPGTPNTSVYNGTTWGAAAPTGKMGYIIYGRALDLRYRITSSASDRQVNGVGILYDIQDSGLATENKSLEKQIFSAALNLNEFTITQFVPDADILTVYYAESGQAFRVGGFQVDGQKIIFPANSFDGGGDPTATITLIFDQTRGGGFDNSDVNALLMAGNHLGSTDTGIDRSVPGRGIFLRSPNGTLYEVAVDDSGNVVSYSV